MASLSSVKTGGGTELLVGLAVVLVEERDQSEVHLGLGGVGRDACSFGES